MAKEVKDSYASAMSKIEGILQKIESGQADIDIISEQVKEASSLIRLCKEKLRKAEKEVEAALNDNAE